MFPPSHKSLPVPLRDLTPFWWDSVSLTLFLLSQFQAHPFPASSPVPALSGHIIPTPEGSICFLFFSLPISSLPSPVFPVFPPHNQYCNSFSYYCLENEQKNQHLSRWIQPLHTAAKKGWNSARVWSLKPKSLPKDLPKKTLCLVGAKNWTLLQQFSWCLGEIIWFLRVV